MADATIQVKHLNGSNYEISISLDETIASLKEKVNEFSEIPVARQRIIHKGAEVHNHIQLAAAGLTDGAVVHLVERLITPAEPGPPPGARPEQASAPPPLAAATMTAPMGGGLEVVNNLVQQMIGGLLQTPSGPGSPLSPGSPRGRAPLRNPNGLEAVHGFVTAIEELGDVDDPPAPLPIARAGTPSVQSSYQSVTRATTAIVRDHERLHGSLQDALAAATNSQNIDAATVNEISALFTRVGEAHAAARASAAPNASAAAGSTATAAAAAAPAEPTGTSPLGQAAAGAAAATYGAASSQQVQEQVQLAVLAYALTMARSAQCMQRFTERMSERAQQLAQEVVREIAAGEQTFPASQVLMEQLGTAANRASGLTLEAAYLSSLFTQAVRGDHSLLPDGMRPVVLQRDSQHRSATTTGAPTAAAEAAPEPADVDGATSDAAPPPPPASAAAPTGSTLRAISINPGYAPMMISQGSGVSNRFRMPHSVRSVSVSGNQGQMEMFLSQGTDPAAGEIIEGMLASGIVTSTPQAPGTQATQPAAGAAAAGGEPPAAVPASAGDAATPQTSAPAGVPPTQPRSGLPIFHSDGTGAQHAAAGMSIPIHVSSSVVTAGPPFGNHQGSMDMPDDTVDVGGMSIQVELPPDGGSSAPNVHTIGQLGSVLQNMMQEQLAAARMSQGRSNPAVTRQAAPGSAPDAGAVPASGTPTVDTAPPSAGGGGAAQPPAGAGLPQRVLQLTQQLVADLSQQQSLPEAERRAAGARMARSYLRQVPELLRQAAPGVADGVDTFLSEIHGAAAGPATATPQPPPAAAAAAAAAAAPGTAAPTASVPVSSTAGPAAHALDIDAEDHSPVIPEESSTPVVSVEAAAGGPAAAVTAAASSAAGPSTGTASESTRSDHPEPKGLARGLKPRKPKGLGLGAGTRGAASATDRSGSSTRAAAGAGATDTDTSGADALPTMVPGGPMGGGAAVGGGAGAPPGLEALLGSLGGAGGGGGAAGGGGGLMDMVANMAQNPNVQRMMASPQMQGVASQMESGNADFGSLLQQMMPMVGSMLGGAGGPGGLPGMPAPAGSGGTGGGANTAAGAGARSAGVATGSTGAASGAGSTADVGAFRGMLGEVMGEGEADRWMRQIIQDRSALRQQGAVSEDKEHSEVYAAGAIPEETGKGAFGI